MGASAGLAGIRAGGGTDLFSGPGDAPFPRFTATFSDNQQPSGTRGRGPPASMPAQSDMRCFRPEYIVARSSRPVSARTAAGALRRSQGCIAGNICRRNPDIRSRLPAFPSETHTPRPRANVTHIGPEQPGNARPCGNRGQPGELMILILPAEPGYR